MANMLVAGAPAAIAVVPSSTDERLIQSGISVGQVGVYPVVALALACSFVVMLVSTFRLV
jgi:hypothetical protein